MIKAKIKKIIDWIKNPDFLYSSIPADIFPERSLFKLQINSKLKKTEEEIKKKNISYNLGSLNTPAHKESVEAYRLFLKHNPNNLGNWSLKREKQGTERLEFEVIQKLINLYHADSKNIEGYISSGGTEGNMFSLWLGRKSLKKSCPSKSICLLRTEMTHYSVKKAASISETPQFIIPINHQEWNVDITSLEKQIINLYQQGYKGFLLPLTFGHTITGTQDDIAKIIKMVKKLKKELKKSCFFIWIDAATNGLIEPFINKNFKPFSQPLVQAMVVDFHKFGLTPYPTGIILYRKKLRKNIEQNIDYLEEKDNTLLGSRPGASAAAIWAIIHHLGRKGYQKIILTELKNKDFFIKKIKEIIPQTEIITHKNSPSCGVIFRSLKNQRLPKNIEEKYWLYPAETNFLFGNKRRKKQTIYKFFFLPHVKKRVVMEIIRDLGHK